MQLRLSYAFLFLLLLTLSSARQLPPSNIADFEPCDYCKGLYDLTYGSGIKEESELCDRYQDTSREQCIDYASVYSKSLSYDMSFTNTSAFEYCESIDACFCHTCKNVAKFALGFALRQTAAAEKTAVATYMCKALRRFDIPDNECIEQLIRKFDQRRIEHPSQGLSNDTLCRFFGTCDFSRSYYPSTSCGGYFYNVSAAERRSRWSYGRQPCPAEPRPPSAGTYSRVEVTHYSPPEYHLPSVPAVYRPSTFPRATVPGVSSAKKRQHVKHRRRVGRRWIRKHTKGKKKEKIVPEEEPVVTTTTTAETETMEKTATIEATAAAVSTETATEKVTTVWRAAFGVEPPTESAPAPEAIGVIPPEPPIETKTARPPAPPTVPPSVLEEKTRKRTIPETIIPEPAPPKPEPRIRTAVKEPVAVPPTELSIEPKAAQPPVPKTAPLSVQRPQPTEPTIPETVIPKAAPPKVEPKVRTAEIVEQPVAVPPTEPPTVEPVEKPSVITPPIELPTIKIEAQTRQPILEKVFLPQEIRSQVSLAEPPSPPAIKSEPQPENVTIAEAALPPATLEKPSEKPAAQPSSPAQEEPVATSLPVHSLAVGTGVPHVETPQPESSPENKESGEHELEADADHDEGHDESQAIGDHGSDRSGLDAVDQETAILEESRRVTEESEEESVVESIEMASMELSSIGHFQRQNWEFEAWLEKDLDAQF